MKPNLALVPDADCIEFYKADDRYWALENGVVSEVTPGSRHYLIVLEQAIKHPSYSQMLKKFGRGNPLVYGFFDLVLSGFNEVPDIAGNLLNDQDGELYTSAGKVNPREREVIEKISEGKCDKEIAQELFISHYTVATTIRNIRYRLNANSKYQIVFRATQLGIL